MATVTRENIGVLNDKLTVNLSKEDYLPQFEKSLKTYAKNANIPGFRKGMVPAGLVKKMYGASVFTDEVLKTVEKELNNYVDQEKLDIFAQPLPLENDAAKVDFNNPSDYSFAFEVGLKPEVNIDVKDIVVTRYKVEVTDAMVDDEVSRMQLRTGNMTEPETIESDEAVLNVHAVETDENGNIAEGGIAKDIAINLKDFTEETAAELKGKKKDDTITIQLGKALKPDEKDNVFYDLGLDKEESTKNDKFFVLTITKIGVKEKAELNENFFETVYPGREIKTEQEFRDSLKGEIEKYYAAQSANQMHDAIYHELVDHTQVEFPENFLKRWLQTSGEKPKTEEDAAKDYPVFSNQLKWSLISTKLSEENKVEVQPQEIKDYAVQQVFNYMGGQNIGDNSWLDDYANRMMKDKKFVEQAYAQIQANKLFTAIESKVQQTEELISAEEFAKKLHHHHH